MLPISWDKTIQRLVKIKDHKAHISELEIPEESAIKMSKSKSMLYDNNNKILSLNTENFDFIFFTKLRKEKQYLIFETEIGIEYIFDFDALKFITKPRSIVNYFCEDNDTNNLAHQYAFLYEQLNKKEKVNILEWPFSYLDLIEDYWGIEYVNFPCEKGYIKYLRKTNQKISLYSYTSFCFFRSYKNINNYYFMQSYLFESFSKISDEKLPWLTENENFINKLRLSSTLSFKRGLFSNFSRYLSEIIWTCWKMNDYAMIDSNATLKSNFEAVKTTYDTKKSEVYKQVIDSWITSLDLVPLDRRYCIKIPNRIEDLIDEGIQQHNCIGGSNYQQKIIEKERLVFFIRSIKDPKKSFITCYYDFRTNMVKDYLCKYNTKVPRQYFYLIHEANTLIKKIMIKKEKEEE